MITRAGTQASLWPMIILIVCNECHTLRYGSLIQNCNYYVTMGWTTGTVSFCPRNIFPQLASHLFASHAFRTNCISLTNCLAIVYEDILMMHADAEQTLKLLLQRMAVRGNGMVNFCKSSTWIFVDVSCSKSSIFEIIIYWNLKKTLSDLPRNSFLPVLKYD